MSFKRNLKFYRNKRRDKLKLTIDSSEKLAYLLLELKDKNKPIIKTL